MLKTAFDMGVKMAFDEEDLTPEQMLAAQRIGGAGGGVAGAGLGGLLGHYLGGRAAESFDFDPSVSKTVGAGLGALAGGGLGGLVGSQIPKWKYREGQPQGGQPQGGQPQEESALGALPAAYSPEQYMGLSDYGYDDSANYNYGNKDYNNYNYGNDYYGY